MAVYSSVAVPNRCQGSHSLIVHSEGGSCAFHAE